MHHLIRRPNEPDASRKPNDLKYGRPGKVGWRTPETLLSPSLGGVSMFLVSCLKKQTIIEVCTRSRLSLEAADGFESLLLRQFSCFLSRGSRFGTLLCPSSLRVWLMRSRAEEGRLFAQNGRTIAANNPTKPSSVLRDREPLCQFFHCGP
jgi:hypothetical protein